MMGVGALAVALMMITVITSPCVYGEEFSDPQEIKVQRLLRRLNKPALKSIKSEDGDIIDCVPITSQPALDHPLLKNHTIQMRPSSITEDESKNTKKKQKAIIQVWHKSGDCPENTVPIRRTKKEDILRAQSLKSFRRKTHRRRTAEYKSPNDGHEYAIMELKTGKFFGTEFTVNIWNPKVQVSNEFSLAQTWLVSGEGPNTNTIEAGWQVFDKIYHDNNTRLFVFWTNNGYQGPVCYNLACQDPGFVQVSTRFVVGGTIFNPVSQYDGEQQELSMNIRKYDDKNWWLKIGEEFVGYWSDDLFTSLKDGATVVQWGGEIVNAMTDGTHTTTEMGSGHFAEEGFKKASYFKNLMVYDEANTLKEPLGLYPKTGHDACYNIKAGDAGTDWGVNFFFGGPGRNDNCA